MHNILTYYLRSLIKLYAKYLGFDEKLQVELVRIIQFWALSRTQISIAMNKSIQVFSPILKPDVKVVYLLLF